MSEKTILEKATTALTEQFGSQALIDFKARFGDAAADNHAAIAYHIRALKARGAPFQASRNHL